MEQKNITLTIYNSDMAAVHCEDCTKTYTFSLVNDMGNSDSLEEWLLDHNC